MAADPLGGLDIEALRALVDAILPADEYPSATEAGAEPFLRRVLGADRPDWVPRLHRVLDRVAATAADRPLTAGLLDGLLDDEDYRWFCDLVAHGYFADPAGGGNRDGASWRMIGWRPDPAAGWPADAPPHRTTGVIAPERLADRYDVIVIGSGAGGGVAAAVLAAAGRRVLVVEAGDWPDAGTLATDHLRNPRTGYGLDALTGPPSAGHPRTVDGPGGTLSVAPYDPRWSNNAMTLGGGTRVYGAQAWRFTEADFAMASTYGVPAGSALADWPIGYRDLEPYYARAEWEIGVAGSADGDSAAAFRSRGYPMPPLPATPATRVLAAGAVALGLRTTPVPLLINSVDYRGRPACARCAQCVGFACPIEAKAGSHNTTLAAAVDTGRCAILLSTTAERIATDRTGRATGVALVGAAGTGTWRREIAATEVVVAAGAIETARLLLNSASDREPDGLGNNTGQVGRHLQGHLYAGALGIFPDPVVDLIGPGPAIATCDFRHGNAGIVGGGMLANEFVPTPVSTYQYLRQVGFLPAHGPDVKRGMREMADRMHRIVGPVQEVTGAESRVRLDPVVRDRFGVPVARLSGGLHAEDLRAQRFLSDRAAEWLTASGATRTARYLARGTGDGPSGGQHQAGTCRMGTDPARSVVDPTGRVWGHDNVRIVDASVHVTNGGVNPVLTILANAYRSTELMLRGGA